MTFLLLLELAGIQEINKQNEHLQGVIKGKEGH